MTALLLLYSTLVLLSFTKPSTLTQALCLADQRHALLQLKKGFETDQLQSWSASTDCCSWDGVTCDQLTGLVIAVDLTWRNISGELSPALFNLSSLQYLNLSYKVFDGVELSQTGFERLANLTHLNLSTAGFSGQVPFGISLLINLISLDLSYNHFEVHDPDLQTLLRNLINLQVLYLDRSTIISPNRSEWAHALFPVRNTLEELSMVECRLTGPLDPSLGQLKQLTLLQLGGNNLNSHFPTFLANFSRLSVLSLPYCELRGQFPVEIFHHTNLTFLDLTENPMLTGQLPGFTSASFLQSLSLSSTNFIGPIPDSIGNLQKLSTLDLSSTNITGPVPNSIGNLKILSTLFLSSTKITGPLPNSIGNLQNLSNLDLSYSDFYGEIPASMANLTTLTFVDFHMNKFTGMIPISLLTLPSLEVLVLSENQFTGYLFEFSNWSLALNIIDFHNNNLQGMLPISIFKLPLLDSLNLASNNFTGIFNLDIIKQSKNLNYLDLSHNNLSITQGENHDKSFYDSFPTIYILILASCGITKFPSFLNYQTDIDYLDLSNNKMDGILPNVPRKIKLLDFSSNHFSQWLSPFTFPVSYLLLSNNRLTGDIPFSICNTSLIFLDLSYNHLNGTMPPCLYGSTAALKIINLKNNNLSGTFPRDITKRCALRTLILSGNRINGSFPLWLVNCTDLEVLDLANNEIRNTFPYFLGNLQNLRVLVLRSNQFYGTISNMEMNNKINVTIFPMLQVFDVSSNSLIGTWPKNFFGFLKAMVTNLDPSYQTISYQLYYSDYHYSVTVTFKGRDMDIQNSLGIFNSLDLSNNGFWGEIPEEIGQLKSLDLLNLSHNAFTGSIPSQLANLEQLESLDLSFNQFSGHIPEVLTSLTFLETLNLSYNNLVGEIPQANQFLTYKNDSYLGNPGLCGIPLTVQCRAPPSNHAMNESPSKSSLTDDIPIGLSISIGVGFAVGFASIIWVLVSWENGRKWLYFKVDRLYFMHFYR